MCTCFLFVLSSAVRALSSTVGRDRVFHHWRTVQHCHRFFITDLPFVRNPSLAGVPKFGTTIHLPLLLWNEQAKNSSVCCCLVCRSECLCNVTGECLVVGISAHFVRAIVAVVFEAFCVCTWKDVCGI